MSSEEVAVLTAVYELGDHQPKLIPYDEIADRLDTTITAVRSVVGLLRHRGLAVASFGGVQLDNSAITLVANA